MSDQYHVKDNSLMLPILRRVVWDRVLDKIPASVSANTLTLAGTAMSAAAFAICALAPKTRWAELAVGLLIYGYLSLDNLDGAHARKTKTGSPLGEFLDHWLDSLNLSFLFMGAVLMWSIPPDRAVAIMALSTLSYAMTFWEQKETGRIYMAALGNVEGIVIVGVFHFAGAIVGPQVVASAPVLFGMSAVEVLYVSAILTTLITSVGPLIRVRKGLGEAAFATAPFIALPVWYYTTGEVSWMIVCAVLMLLSPAVAGRMLIGHVMKTDRGPSRLLLALILASAAAALVLPIGRGIENAIMVAILICALLQVAFDFMRTVRSMSEHLRPNELLALSFPRVRL